MNSKRSIAGCVNAICSLAITGSLTPDFELASHGKNIPHALTLSLAGCCESVTVNR